MDKYEKELAKIKGLDFYDWLEYKKKLENKYCVIFFKKYTKKVIDYLTEEEIKELLESTDATTKKSPFNGIHHTTYFFIRK